MLGTTQIQMDSVVEEDGTEYVTQTMMMDKPVVHLTGPQS